MPYDEYWYGDPWLCEAYRQAHKLKIEQRNQELWLQGLYMYDAFAVVLSNSFGKRGGKKAKYMDEPIRLFPMTEAEKAAKEAKDWARIDAQLHAIQAAQRRKNAQLKAAKEKEEHNGEQHD